MSDEQQITIGEIYRICVETKALVKEQNGRVRKLEDDNIRIKTMWSVGVFVAGFCGDWAKHKLGF